MHDETIAIHGGYTSDGTRAVAVPIYQTVAHDFIDAAHAGAVLDLETPGFHYNRLNNPTLDVLEQRICALEGGTAALVVASGMAAVSYAILTVATAGSNIVVAPQLYGATFTYFAHILPTLGIEARFAVDDRAESIAPLIDENTRAVFCETIGNPAGNIVDLEAVAAVAHAAGVPLIVDNTVATPLMLKPFEHGADVVVHSLTKFVGGHGTTLGGAIVDGGRFPWADHPDRFPMFNEPEPAFHGVVFARDFPERPFTTRARSTQLRNSGATLSPFNAFLLLQGLETMAVRLERHEANARAVAEYLAADPRVAWVSFAGFPDHPYHHLVDRYLHGRVPSIITFGAEGGYDAGLAFFDALQLVKRLLNLGDAKTLAIHPASTTHRQLSGDELASAGIRPETIRLSIGIEHIDDIIDDIDQALDKAEANGRAGSVEPEMPLTTTEVPTFFGPSDSPLFGVVHLPADNQIRGGVVICGSLGKEGMDSVRLHRILADRLAHRGFGVLRFDYLGLGDSAYAQVRDDAVANWVASVGHALDYLSLIGAESTTAIGIRAGCLILDDYLAQSRAQSHTVDRAVYLDPPERADVTCANTPRCSACRWARALRCPARCR